MVRNTLPNLIRYGKYKPPSRIYNGIPYKPSKTDKQFKKELTMILGSLCTVIGGGYGFIYWSYCK